MDIEQVEGRELLLRLVGGADILIESFGPGRLISLGIGYQVLEKTNPRLILASITYFGQNGPYRDYQAPGNGFPHQVKIAPLR